MTGVNGRLSLFYHKDLMIYLNYSMTYDRFTQSLTDALPPKGITDLLTALWWEKKGDWHKAHIITQEIHTNDASLIHAYLHRREGDLSNANYWYHTAGVSVFIGDLNKEWGTLVKRLL